MSHHYHPIGGGLAKQLVVLLHGYGADGEDLIALAPMLGQVLPEAAFVAPNAPFPCAAGWGYQWFDVWDADGARRLEGARLADKILQPFYDAQLQAHNVPAEELYIVGFSQGTMMALHSGLRRPVPPRAIVGFAGRLMAAHLLADELACRPPIMLAHGAEDDVVPVESLEQANAALRAAGLEVESHVIEGLGHGIDETGILYAARFLKRIHDDAA
ncbi:MAG: prolyl oligopeptidase family serine peptidase [Alphaproteobacteria bacterium]|nr:prolyl oligopeptidase family serine peptidase [Alphaproteobacteria bacterium]MCB9930710.1 prolyl oligopeptidase family serine peptidase [Alphaproteobacteria bacterium]